jgi:hypothetical protein
MLRDETEMKPCLIAEISMILGTFSLNTIQLHMQQFPQKKIFSGHINALIKIIHTALNNILNDSIKTSLTYLAPNLLERGVHKGPNERCQNKETFST